MTPDERAQLESDLSAYLDGELTGPERAQVEAFLAEYPEARSLLDELRLTAESVHSLPRAQAAEELLEGLRSRLERRALLEAPALPDEAVPPPSGPSWMKWMAAAAVIGLTVGTVYFMYPFGTHKEE